MVDSREPIDVQMVQVNTPGEHAPAAANAPAAAPTFPPPPSPSQGQPPQPQEQPATTAAGNEPPADSTAATNNNPDEAQPTRQPSQKPAGVKIAIQVFTKRLEAQENLSKEELQRREAEAVRELERQLPRPEWYTSGEDEPEEFKIDDEDKEVTDLKRLPLERQSWLIVYTVLCAIAFVFNLVSSCPIPWIRGHDGRKYGVWRATGGHRPVRKVNNIHDCANEMQYWQASAAFSIFATFTSCAALIAAALLCVGKGHLGTSFILNFYSVAYSLVSWSLCVALFHYYRCGKGVFANGLARLDAGFVLTMLAWVIQLVALILLYALFRIYYTRSIHAGKTHLYRFIFLGLLCVIMMFYCVGPAYTLWSKNFGRFSAHVTMWHVEVHDKTTLLSTFISRRAYQCTTLTRRMKVAAAFNIMGCIMIFFALCFALSSCYNEKHVRLSNFCGFVAALFVLVEWIVLLVIRHSHLCTGSVPPGSSEWADLGYNGIPTGVNNAQIRYDGYALRSGFALIVTGWAVNVLSVILNCVL